MPYHILIVEDDDSLRKLYSLYLERGQFEHTEVSSAQEALELLPDIHFDVLMVDVNLGNDINGLQFIEIVRHDKQYDDIKIVILTSFPDRFDIADLLRINLSLNKPVSYNQLINALRQLF
jgi:putative two-component system response regulator